MPQLEKTFFGLRYRESGELIRLNSSAGYNDCSSHMELTLDEAHPHLAFDSSEHLACLLMQDTPHYNANSAKSANWGEFSREDLVPAKVRIVQEVEDIELRERLQVKSVEVRTIPRRVAKAYAGEEMPHPSDTTACFWLAYLPEGMSIGDINQHIGQLVFPKGDRYLGRELLKARHPPGEYAPLLKGAAGVLLLTREYGA